MAVALRVNEGGFPSAVNDEFTAVQMRGFGESAGSLPATMEKVRAHIFISGRVQGVCFRMFAEEEALNRRLTGWIRNCPDGRVEAIFEGEKASIESMIRWCEHGPPAAKVRDVATEWEPFQGDLRDFRVI